MMLLIQIGREICLQYHIILINISISDTCDTIIISQESGRRHIVSKYQYFAAPQGWIKCRKHISLYTKYLYLCPTPAANSLLIGHRSSTVVNCFSLYLYSLNTSTNA